MPPTIIPVADTAAFAVTAAACFGALLRDRPDALVVLPAGMTPLPFYAAMRADYAAGKIDNQFAYVALDEYCGLPDGDARLFASWLGREILDPLAIPAARRIGFHSGAADPAVEAARMEHWLATHPPIDIAVIGLGHNGHVGFNEPGSALDSRARLVSLTTATRQANAAYWGSIDRVPLQAYTLGIGNLRAARHTILLVRGAAKAAILRQALTGAVTPDIPASYLQQQDNVTVIADREALGG